MIVNQLGGNKTEVNQLLCLFCKDNACKHLTLWSAGHAVRHNLQ